MRFLRLGADAIFVPVRLEMQQRRQLVGAVLIGKR
jgi:hypothetical protein